MHVDTAVSRQVQNGLTQDLAVGHDDNQVRLPAGDNFKSLRTPKLLWLKNRDLRRFRRKLYRGRSCFLSASRRAVWLRDDADDRISLR